MKIRFLVTFDLPTGACVSDAHDYLLDHLKQVNPTYKGKPMARLDSSSVIVQHKLDRLAL